MAGLFSLSEGRACHRAETGAVTTVPRCAAAPGLIDGVGRLGVTSTVEFSRRRVAVSGVWR